MEFLHEKEDVTGDGTSVFFIGGGEYNMNYD
jgi:hypothetical protein